VVVEEEEVEVEIEDITLDNTVIKVNNLILFLFQHISRHSFSLLCCNVHQ
jgi:hypothetical protein